MSQSRFLQSRFHIEEIERRRVLEKFGTDSSHRRLAESLKDHILDEEAASNTGSIYGRDLLYLNGIIASVVGLLHRDLAIAVIILVDAELVNEKLRGIPSRPSGTKVFSAPDGGTVSPANYRHARAKETVF